MNKRSLAYAALVATAVIWGAQLPIVKLALPTVTPSQFLFLRFLLVSLLSLPFVIRHLRALPLSRKQVGQIIALEVLGTPVALSFLYVGLTLTSAIESSLLSATLPIFLTIGGILFLREQQQLHEWLGLLLGIIGTIIIVVTAAASTQSSASLAIGGDLLVVGFLIISTIYYLIAKILYRGLSKLLISALSAFVAVPVFAAILLATGEWPDLGVLREPTVIFATVYSATLGWLAANSLYLYGQHMIEASEASVFRYLEGIVAIPVAWFLLQEQPSVLLWFAIGTVASGVAVSSWRPQPAR